MIIRAVTRVLFAAYFLEAGLILIVAPWSSLWDHNVYAVARPALAAFLQNAYVRGAVSGIGAVTAVAGIVELVMLLSSRRRPAPPEEQARR